MAKKRKKFNLLKLIGSTIVTAPGSSDFLSAIIYTIIIFGLIFSSSASMKQTTTVMSFSWSVTKQIIIVVVGTVAYHVCSVWMTEKCYKKNINLFVTFEFIALIAAFCWSRYFGSDNGSYAWIYIGGFSFQPSEFAKIIGVLVVAAKLSDLHSDDYKKAWEILLIPFLIIIAYAGIIAVVQSDKGTAVVFLAIVGICLLIPNHKLLGGTQIAMLLLVAVGGFAYVYMMSDKGIAWLASHESLATIANRFMAVKNPSFEYDGTREIFYSLLGISKGKLTGVGLGNSVQKFGYLVSSDADYIFSIIVEETGIIGISIVFVLYALLIGTLLYYAARVEYEGDRVCLVGAVAYLFVHFFFNIGGVSGFIPLTGVPLLLLSRGGSAFLSIMCMLGICQNAISRYNRSHKKAKN